jgi:NAD(P)-dependent dehydrogenase (short-subunit alcohol dehydrogenase family)
MNKLDNKVAVITGGSSGIGLATARLFKQEGAKVAIIGRDDKALRAAADSLGVLGANADVRKPAELDAAFAKIHRELGTIDVVFANAGIGPSRAFAEVDEAFFDEMFAINTRGVYFTVQRALPYLADGASIILSSSGAAHVGVPMTSVYAASKAAVGAMARNLAAELLPRRIRVNALSPGLTETRALSPEGLGLPPAFAAEFAKRVMPLVPMGRLATADEIARGALFLASDDSSFVLGFDLHVTGGITTL